MVGGLIVTFTGAIRIAFRFINRVLGFLLVFTGAWFTLAVMGAYQGYLTYQARKNGLPAWLAGAGNGATFAENETVAAIVWAVAIGVGLCLFAYNCYRFYTAMPDNFLKRLIMLFFGRNYRPEREGGNIPDHMRKVKRRDTGFYFGKKRMGIFATDVVHVGKPTGADGHILVVGGAGTGKSAAIAKNALETWNAPIVALDIKGELSEHYLKTKNIAKSDWRPMKRFEPTKQICTGYDPYYLLRQSGANSLTQYAREIAIAIIPLPHDVRDPFWIQSAQNLLTAAILYHFDLGNSFTDTMVSIQTTPVDNSTEEFDLPTESVFQSVAYDSTAHVVTFTLVSGSTTSIDLSDLIPVAEDTIEYGEENNAAIPTIGAVKGFVVSEIDADSNEDDWKGVSVGALKAALELGTF